MKINIEHIRSQWVLLLFALVGSLLAGCSSDEVPGAQSVGTMQLLTVTRSGGDAYEDVTTDYSPIQLYLVADDAENKNGRFTYDGTDDVWKSTIEVEDGTSYTVFGYAPATAATANLDGATTTGATLVLNNVSAVMRQDICVVAGVQQLENATTPTKNIVQGQLGFIGKSMNQNFANLLLAHLYASIRFTMTINPDYATLRSIKVKKLELRTDAAGTVNISVPLAPNDTGTSPIGTVGYTPVSGSSYAIFYENADGVTLTETGAAVDATCYFVPNVVGNLTLVSTYEISDRNGKLIGERTAVNKLPTSLSAHQGQRLELKLVVNPTYLYVLSEPDLDNPTVKFE